MHCLMIIVNKKHRTIIKMLRKLVRYLLDEDSEVREYSEVKTSFTK